MTWWKRLFCWLLMAALILLWRPLARMLPVDNGQLAAEVYDGWTGTLRIWVSEGWQCGTGQMTGWLNRCASSFEKAHPGVYLQIEQVQPGTLTDFSAANPGPDAILFAPGMLKDPGGLIPLEENSSLRAELKETGCWGDNLYALPVAMGGYAWAINKSLLEEAPLDWARLPPLSSLNKQPRYLMQIPSDEAWRCWSAAAEGLCAPRRVLLSGQEISFSQEEIDLGLLTADPSPTPLPQTQLAFCTLPLELPPDFMQNSSAFSGFTQGLYAAIPVTQREIYRLRQLSDQGKAPDWAVQGSGAPFTDQLLFMGVVESRKKEPAARHYIMKEFLSHLLSDGMQNALTTAGAFRVTSGERLYPQDQGMNELEQFTLQLLRPAEAFHSAYRAQGKAAMERMVLESRKKSS